MGGREPRRPSLLTTALLNVSSLFSGCPSLSVTIQVSISHAPDRTAVSILWECSCLYPSPSIKRRSRSTETSQRPVKENARPIYRGKGGEFRNSNVQKFSRAHWQLGCNCCLSYRSQFIFASHHQPQEFITCCMSVTA